ncbi:MULTISPECIES: alpha/beta fold hydrolase [unclassified Streptomyces]|uniref:alpha/beta fold hydrolase n=1 Tax=unclassified Streptomyces TaxID=2593676 RepID=UPI00364DA593
MQEQGDGDRTAVLIHGGMADHGTWHAVTSHLVRQGYRVLAPDLRGHGRSARGAYRPAALAEDLTESLPTGADIAIGHSLGGLALALAVGQLAPRRVVYSDPGFRLNGMGNSVPKGLHAMVDQASRESIQRANPRWSKADVKAELAGFALFDRAFLPHIESFDGDYLPAPPAVPSLVQLADPSLTIDAATAELLRSRGFEITVVAGAGHCIHRDDFQGFIESLRGWI